MFKVLGSLFLFIFFYTQNVWAFPDENAGFLSEEQKYKINTILNSLIFEGKLPSQSEIKLNQQQKTNLEWQETNFNNKAYSFEFGSLKFFSPQNYFFGLGGSVPEASSVKKFLFPEGPDFFKFWDEWIKLSFLHQEADENRYGLSLEEKINLLDYKSFSNQLSLETGFIYPLPQLLWKAGLVLGYKYQKQVINIGIYYEKTQTLSKTSIPKFDISGWGSSLSFTGFVF